MSDKTEKLIENLMLTEGNNQLVVLTGKAPDPVNPENQKSVNANGRIDAPGNYYQARKEAKQFKQKDCIVTANYDKKSIKLEIFPDFTHKTVTITGKLTIDHRLARFHINEDKMYDRDDLAQLFKFNRSAFANVQEGMNFVKKLRDFELQLEQTFQAKDDQRGNVKALVERVIKEDTDIPKTIVLDLPIFEGGENHQITVDVLFNVNSHGDVNFWLESGELASEVDETTISIIEKELQRFDDIAIIYV